VLTEDVQDYFYHRVGELIKDARNKAEVTQDELARILGMSRISIVNIEQGKQKIQLHTLIEMVNYLGIPISDFFTTLNFILKPNVTSKKIENKIKKEVNPENTIEINKLKEFINLSISKHK
jgi:DNA-binding XRE family transcriptional regulator